MSDRLGEALQQMHERGLKVRGIGIAWFTPESYQRLLAIAADRAELPETFEAWERRVTERFERRVAAGQPLEKVLIDVDRLAAFCHELGCPVDVMARSAFTAITLGERDRGGGQA